MSRPVMAFLALLFAASVSAGHAQSSPVGRGAVSDDKNYNDRLTLTMIGVPAVPRDKVYEAWLVTDNGIELFSIGNLKVEPNGTVSHGITRDENLFAHYNKLRVSVEPRDKQDPKQAGETVFQGEIPLPVMTQMRELMVHSTDASGGTALSIGLRTQSSLMLKHLNLMSAAASTADMGKLKENAEAVVNIVEGAKGAHFGDLNKDQSVQNPGDGYGLLNYVDSAITRADLLSAAEGATPEMTLGAAEVKIAASNVGTWAGQVRDGALLVLEAGDIDGARPHLEGMMKQGIMALNGTDANDNGLIEPIEGEAGAVSAYVYAQEIGNYNVRSVAQPMANASAAGPQGGNGSGPTGKQNVESSEQSLASLILLGLLAATGSVAFMAILWARSRTSMTRR